MRMSFKAAAVAVALMTAGLTGTAAPAMARDGISSGIVLVHDTGRRHSHDRDRYERRHHRGGYDRRDRHDRRDRYERRHSRHDRDHRRDRRDRRDNDIVIRLR
ncbi:hypothetical protein [Aureimonas glaciei]|uniref:hypothetical protein n=1 Tax=Aureimonas glaciei TaxID=1776957 RepID=UPI00166DCEAF|nr:hypothetical protein [Aureimonas glaciei]